jgi:hypothetical protein
MRRIWLYLKESTVQIAVEAMKRMTILDHGKRKRAVANEEDDAAEDLKRAKRLTDTGVTREEIEHASQRHDEGENGS